MMIDPIIDRSPEQVEKLISESRIAINPYGYTVVRTAFLQHLLDVAHEETNTVVRDRSAPATHEPG